MSRWYSLGTSYHLYSVLDDEDEDERNAGIDMGLELLNICDELWAFGDKISEGMLNEIESAKSLGIIVRRFNERCEPLDE